MEIHKASENGDSAAPTTKAQGNKQVLFLGWALMNSLRFRVIAGPSPAGRRCQGVLGRDAAKHLHPPKPTLSRVSKQWASFTPSFNCCRWYFPPVNFHSSAKPWLQWDFLSSLIHFSLCHFPKNSITPFCQSGDGRNPPKKLFQGYFWCIWRLTPSEDRKKTPWFAANL